MSTQPIAVAASTSETAPSSTAENPNGVLGQNSFLQLMIAQLQDQDPLQPGNANEYVNELAQLTQVEQTTNLANASELSGAVQLIGRTVSYNDAAGQTVSGKVESVQSTVNGTTVTIEGTPGVKITDIIEVN